VAWRRVVWNKYQTHDTNVLSASYYRKRGSEWYCRKKRERERVGNSGRV